MEWSLKTITLLNSILLNLMRDYSGRVYVLRVRGAKVSNNAVIIE